MTKHNHNIAEITAAARKVLEKQPSGLIPISNVQATNRHEAKNWRGRLIDWVTWKTPLKKWLVKPYYKRESVAQILEDICMHGDQRTAERITDELLEDLRYIYVWRKCWPENPYEMLDVNYTFLPPLPVQRLFGTFILDTDDSEAAKSDGPGTPPA